QGENGPCRVRHTRDSGARVSCAGALTIPRSTVSSLSSRARELQYVTFERSQSREWCISSHSTIGANPERRRRQAIEQASHFPSPTRQRSCFRRKRHGTERRAR